MNINGHFKVWGYICPGGICPGGVYVQGVSVQGVCVRGGKCPGLSVQG